ncbi:mannitol dehydrogenase family protein [Jatrophihabitans sp.]|jgi:mannitol 2-dehydrogenase|uniref:mannitol dehydrogenase family protein n=1 Tax=Jatrophihabitans sp. TaxID=1932789 RepID=UPI002F003372
MRLNAGTLDRLPAAIARPAYDRDKVRVGIVHLGVGGFHRAHQAMYLDRLMNDGQAMDWGICGVGLLPGDRRMQQVMHAQDGLYTLVVKHPDGTLSSRVIGSIVKYLYAPDDPVTVIEALAERRTRIVSLTVTEGGYNLRPGTGRFDDTNLEVLKDLTDGVTPTTWFGYLTEGLRLRRARGLGGFTVVSCDNIEGNGDAARESLSAFATLKDPELGDWIRATVRFPDSMVDRITPATTDADRQDFLSRYGVSDDWPVHCEPFSQWMLEDDFGDPVSGRPPLENAGVTLVPGVRPYELMKLRLLNAGHQALAYLGSLAGHRMVHEATQDPAFAGFLRGYLAEAVPTLEPVPGVDLEEYQQNLLVRFSNANVSDTLARLATDGSDRIPKFLLPVITENLAAGRDVRRSAAVLAGWARYCEGVDELGRPIEVQDSLADRLRANARRQGADPLAFVADRELFGDLVDSEAFRTAYLDALSMLRSQGARATVAHLAQD